MAAALGNGPRQRWGRGNRQEPEGTASDPWDGSAGPPTDGAERRRHKRQCPQAGVHEDPEPDVDWRGANRCTVRAGRPQGPGTDAKLHTSVTAPEDPPGAGPRHAATERASNSPSGVNKPLPRAFSRAHLGRTEDAAANTPQRCPSRSDDPIG